MQIHVDPGEVAAIGTRLDVLALQADLDPAVVALRRCAQAVAGSSLAAQATVVAGTVSAHAAALCESTSSVGDRMHGAASSYAEVEAHTASALAPQAGPR